MQNIYTHFIPCHTAMESYAVATMRTIPDAHPLYKLLKNSFRYTMSINIPTKESIKEGDIYDFIASIGCSNTKKSGKHELTRKCNERYSVHFSNIKRNLKERGVDNPDKLPNYYYRDDGVRLWDAIEAYVRSILDLFYTDDIDVQEDSEIRDWTNEIHSFGFPAFHGGPMGRGFPKQINTKDELVEYCTLIMFTGSAFHSCANFSTFDTYSFVPNGPFEMRRPLPTQKGVTTEDDILHSLPTVINTGLSAALMFSASQYSPDEVSYTILRIHTCSI